MHQRPHKESTPHNKKTPKKWLQGGQGLLPERQSRKRSCPSSGRPRPPFRPQNQLHQVRAAAVVDIAQQQERHPPVPVTMTGTAVHSGGVDTTASSAAWVIGGLGLAGVVWFFRQNDYTVGTTTPARREHVLAAAAPGASVCKHMVAEPQKAKQTPIKDTARPILYGIATMSSPSTNGKMLVNAL